MRFFKETHIDFIGFRRKAMLGSLIVLVAGFISIALHRGLDRSIDFEGGALVEIRLERPVPLGDIRNIISGAGFTEAEVTNFGELNEYLIKVGSVGNATEVAERVKDVLIAKIADQPVEIRRVETVGPKIGKELTRAAIWAVIFSLIGIVVYLSWRFQFRYAIVAILALTFTVLFMLGFISVTGMEVSLTMIAALLTIVGYGVNDTIVVLDRIRENIHSKRRESFDRLVNTSINETLSRTVITGGSVLLVLIALTVLGGEAIRDFSLAMFVGVLVSTYASIFVAAPILVEWQLRRAHGGAKQPAKTRA